MEYMLPRDFLVTPLLTGWQATGGRKTIWAGAVSCHAAVAPADGGCAGRYLRDFQAL